MASVFKVSLIFFFLVFSANEVGTLVPGITLSRLPLDCSGKLRDCVAQFKRNKHRGYYRRRPSNYCGMYEEAMNCLTGFCEPEIVNIYKDYRFQNWVDDRECNRFIVTDSAHSNHVTGIVLALSSVLLYNL